MLTLPWPWERPGRCGWVFHREGEGHGGVATSFCACSGPDGRWPVGRRHLVAAAERLAVLPARRRGLPVGGVACVARPGWGGDRCRGRGADPGLGAVGKRNGLLGAVPARDGAAGVGRRCAVVGACRAEHIAGVARQGEVAGRGGVHAAVPGRLWVRVPAARCDPAGQEHRLPDAER
ncbi:hypothetical protein D3C71_1085720 [compost metagenome]